MRLRLRGEDIRCSEGLDEGLMDSIKAQAGRLAKACDLVACV
jgi:hypothetical protein